jgi:Flp pilus assembly protein TadG
MIGITKKAFSAGAKRLLNCKLARRLLRRDDGAAAVEFALVAAPFLALVFAIMETAMIFFAGQALETAAGDSARLIMTGQAQTASFDAAAFKNSVCDHVYGLFDCDAGMQVDVRTFNSFSSATPPDPLDNNGNLKSNFVYQPGGPGDIVVVRLLYKWPVYVSLLGLNLSNMAGGQRLLVATQAFRNEPYQ